MLCSHWKTLAYWAWHIFFLGCWYIMNLQLCWSCRNYYDIDSFCVAGNGHVTGLQCILSAKVPIIKVTDSGTGIECDLSVDNKDGITKSHIIRAISAIDERFQKLSFLVINATFAIFMNFSIMMFALFDYYSSICCMQLLIFA